MLYIKVQILGQRLPSEVGVKYTFHLERKSDEALKLGWWKEEKKVLVDSLLIKKPPDPVFTWLEMWFISFQLVSSPIDKVSIIEAHQ